MFSFRGESNERYAQPTPSEFDTHLARAAKYELKRILNLWESFILIKNIKYYIAVRSGSGNRYHKVTDEV